MKKSVVFVVCSLLFTFLTPFATGAEESSESAIQVIEKLDATLVECMKKGQELGYSGRYQLLEPVMKKYFFYSLMVRKSTGSWWKSMSTVQQKELLDKYITWSIGSYAERFSTYKDQKFIVAATRTVHKKYMQVVVHIIKADKRKRVLEYLLVLDKEKELWRIVDIRVKGVSQLALTRAQFKSILKKQGTAGLLKLLDEKIKSVSSAGHDPSLTQ